MSLEIKTQGERIAAIRMGRQLSQDQLAEMCDVSRATISRLENNQSKLRGEIATRISLALRIDPTLLETGSTEVARSRIENIIEFLESSGEYLSLQAIDLLESQIKYMTMIDHPQIIYPKMDTQGFNTDWQWGLIELNQIIQSTLSPDLPVGRILIYRQYDMPFGQHVIRHPEVYITSGTGQVPYVTNILDAIGFQEGVFRTEDYKEFREAKGVFSQGINPYVTNITYNESDTRFISIMISTEKEPSLHEFKKLKNAVLGFFAEKVMKKDDWINSLNDFNSES